MHSRWVGYSMGIKSVAFIPSILCFIVFFTLIIVYGRIKPENTTSVPTSNTVTAPGHDIEESTGSSIKEIESSEEKQK